MAFKPLTYTKLVDETANVLTRLAETAAGGDVTSSGKVIFRQEAYGVYSLFRSLAWEMGGMGSEQLEKDSETLRAIYERILF